MNLEHRLQHAARELREVQIDVPPLGTRPAAPTRSRLHALSAPMLLPLLFVVAGLFAIGATRAAGPDTVESDVPATVPAAAVDEPEAEPAATVGTPAVSIDPDPVATSIENQRARRDPAATGPRAGAADPNRYEPV